MKSRFGLSMMLASLMGLQVAATSAAPITSFTPKRKKRAVSRGPRKIGYGVLLKAHFDSKNLTPQRIAAHKAYAAKHA